MITDKGTHIPGESWASDTPISMPETLPAKPGSLVYMDGFAFSETGMVHAMTEADRQIMSFPAFGPELAPDTSDGD